MNEEMKIRRYQSAVTKNTRKASERIIKLEHNWNELKKWLEENKKTNAEMNIMSEIMLSKIKELEEGGNYD